MRATKNAAETKTTNTTSASDSRRAVAADHQAAPLGVRLADTALGLAGSSLQLRSLDEALLQFRGAVASRPTDALQVADRGAQGAGSQLPHLDRIQASFGSHDVTGVRTFSDANARAAASELGAHAYAMDNRVVLGTKSDLHTVAHEAAHVVQQRAGVSLKGGVGQVGDRYEQHADRVADLVVQGKSAEGLLSQMAGGSGGPTAVQLTPRDRAAAMTGLDSEEDADLLEDVVQHAQARNNMIERRPRPYPRSSPDRVVNQPSHVDLGRVYAALEEMAQRLVGESSAVFEAPSAQQWRDQYGTDIENALLPGGHNRITINWPNDRRLNLTWLGSVTLQVRNRQRMGRSQNSSHAVTSSSGGASQRTLSSSLTNARQVNARVGRSSDPAGASVQETNTSGHSDARQQNSSSGQSATGSVTSVDTYWSGEIGARIVLDTRGDYSVTNLENVGQTTMVHRAQQSANASVAGPQNRTAWGLGVVTGMDRPARRHDPDLAPAPPSGG